MTALAQDCDQRMFDPRFREAFRPRLRVWAAMRTFDRPFTASDIQPLTGVGLGEIARLLFGWNGRGLLLRLPNSTSFTMTDTARSHAKPLPIKTEKASPIPRRSGRQRLWSAMRVLRTFDLPTLCMASGTSEANARLFLRSLVNARYVSRAGETSSGRSLFNLLRDSGPLHPILRKHADGAFTVVDLADRNDGSVIRIRTVQPVACDRIESEPTLQDGGVG